MLLTFALLYLTLESNGLDNGLARRPPMGWMSWSKFYCEVDCGRHPRTCISEKLYKEMADRIADDGYLQAGYEYVHIDDCWMIGSRSSDGKLAANATRFPSGISGLASYVHSRGLKLGLYASVGPKTCEGYPGSLGHYQVDAQTFADWKIDYLKVDGCHLQTTQQAGAFMEMSRFVSHSGHQIAYACGWPVYYLAAGQAHKINYTSVAQHCNSWRNYYDITRKHRTLPGFERSWSSVLDTIDWYTANQDRMVQFNRPGQWNDPDSILAGNSELTYDQSRAQMTMWSIWSAPLILSNDLRTIDVESREILLNRRVIAIDQDPLGAMGRMVRRISGAYVYVKPVTPFDSFRKHYSYAFAIFNRGMKPAAIEFMLRDIGLRNDDGYDVQDLWNGTILGRFRPTDTFRASLRATSAQLFKATLPRT